jgi:voltage-gated potassium channel
MTMDRPHLHEHIRRVTEPLIILATILTIPLTVLELRTSSPEILIGDWIVWAVFLGSYILMTATAERPFEYARKDWLTAIIVVVSFPALPALFGLSRLARLLRLVRLVTVVSRSVPALRWAVGRYELVYVTALTALLVAAGGIALSVAEPSLKGDVGAGMWWAIVTVTTVGYGDISPVTPSGRAIAVALMVCGIGLTATLAAAIAAHLVKADRAREHDQLLERLDRLEMLIRGDPAVKS